MEFLAQTTSEQDAAIAMSLGEIIMYGLLAFLVVFALVSTRIVMECRNKGYGNPFLWGTLLYLFSIGPFLMLIAILYELFEPGDWLTYVVFGGPIAWIVTVVAYTVVSAPRKKSEDREDRIRQQELYSELDVVGADKYKPRGPAEDEFGVDDVVPDEEIAGTEPSPKSGEPAPVPRRAVSIPNADSDVSRASEQTLKRMSLEKLEQTATENKAPRASEVDGNPILPDGLVKIRCLDCYKKMQADGAKFAKQRRCPACKAAPFRFKIESS
jgi:hypothetical protein